MDRDAPGGRVSIMNREAPRKRRRPTLACDVCRRRKIRCDRQMPCNHCARSKTGTCTYTQDPVPALRTRSAAVAASSTASSPLSSGSRPGTFNVTSEGSFSSNSHVTMPNNSSTALLDDQSGEYMTNPVEAARSPYSALTIQELVDKVQKLEKMLSDTGGQPSAEPENVPIKLPRITPHTRGNFSKTRFYGHSHWANSVQSFDKLYSFVNGTQLGEKSARDKSTVFSLLEKCKRIARVAKAERSAHHSVPSDFRELLPQRELSDQLVQLYLRTFESVHRILHIPSFQQEYHEYWSNPQASSTAFVIKLLLVMAIGISFYKDQNNIASLHSSSSQWIHAAQSWLGAPFEKSRLNLTGLQIQCLLLIARQTSAVGGDLIWISAGTLVRTAMNMGLHLDPSHFPKMSIFHSELRRRLWATIMEISIQSSLDMGMLPLISLQDYDCEPPSNFNDIDIGESIAAPPVPSMNTFTETSVQIALTRSFQTRLEIVKLINNFRTEPSYDETLRLSAELITAMRSNSLLFQSFLTSSSATETERPDPFQNKLLDILTCRFLLSLHHPFCIKAKANPKYYFSRKACLDSALQILETRAQDNEYNIFAVPGSGIYRSVWVLALSTICFELITQLEEDSSSFNPSSIRSLSFNELHKAIRDHIDLAARRIEGGETNVKSHVLLSTLLGQIDAMIAGTSPEQGIIDAAKKSAELCYGMLRARAGKIIAKQDQYIEDGGGDLGLHGEDISSGWDVLIDQPNLDFEIPDSWLFSGWGSTTSWS